MAEELRYIAWDGSPVVLVGDRAASRDLDGSWKLRPAGPMLRTAERDAPELSREELAASFPDADLAEGVGLIIDFDKGLTPG